MSELAPRVRRAVLFTPGDSLHKLQKAAGLGVDSLILDLEDGVALNRKAEARQTVVEALRTIDFGRTERLIRINPVGSGLEADDLDVTLPAHADGYVIPKVEQRDRVQWVSARIADMERRQGWDAGVIRLLVMIETARAVVNLREIAASDPRLDALIFGAEDLAGSIGAVRTRENHEVSFARSAVVIHAAAFGLQAIDQIYADFNDTPGLIAESERAMQMGYSGKTIIHPRQIEPVSLVFTPSDEAIAQAQRLIEAYNAHQSSGAGAFALDGKMVDAPFIRAAERVLARAQAAGKIG
jgi:citrate lyase beta subunit